MKSSVIEFIGAPNIGRNTEKLKQAEILAWLIQFSRISGAAPFDFVGKNQRIKFNTNWKTYSIAYLVLFLLLSSFIAADYNVHEGLLSMTSLIHLQAIITALFLTFVTITSLVYGPSIADCFDFIYSYKYRPADKRRAETFFLYQSCVLVVFVCVLSSKTIYVVFFEGGPFIISAMVNIIWEFLYIAMSHSSETLFTTCVLLLTVQMKELMQGSQ